MMDSVKAYKQRRAVRMKARMDANEDKGRWVTTENDHKIHFNEGGEPDMGNPHVIAVMKGGGKKTKLEKDVDFPKDESEAVSVEDYQKKKMKEKLDRFSHLMHDEDPESSSAGDQFKSVSDQKARGRGAKEENKEYSYGSIEGHQPTGEEKASESESSGSYERLPFYLRSKKDLDPADRKKVQSTVSRFMKEAKEGDVYECGGGFGSLGGQRFRVVKRRGKLALQWISEGRYSQPVQMSRGNVEEFIRNGAKLAK